MDKQLRLEVEDWEKLWKVIRKSFSINRHVEFFRWLQDEVYEYLPHDALVTAWGDFASGQLSYDVASGIPGVRTQHITEGGGIDALMGNLYYRWRSSNEQWYVLDSFNLAGMNRGKLNGCVAKLGQMKSVLVYGIRDRRGNQDCLYVFFDRGRQVLAQQPTLELLLPQIDVAMRRVGCLAQMVEEDADRAVLCDISEREHEIMNWVRHGKTNHEIGLILGISPNTVKNHLKRIFQKLEVFSRAQAVAKYEGLQPGWLTIVPASRASTKRDDGWQNDSRAPGQFQSGHERIRKLI